MLQFGTLAVSGECDSATALSQPLQYATHAVERFYTFQIFSLIKFSLGFQQPLAFIRVYILGHQLECLVTVETGIQLKEIVRRGDSEAGQGFLKAQQVLAHAVHERAFDIEYVAGKLHVASSQEERA